MRRRRRLAGAILVAIALAAAYQLWFRDSSLVAVNEVEVRGATTSKRAIGRAFDAAAREMTTLDVDRHALAVVAGRFPTIETVDAEASFPHKLTITVTERLPVAVAEAGGDSIGVSGDGHLLAGIDADRSELPTLELNGKPRGALLSEDDAAAAAVLEARPDRFDPKVVEASWDGERGGVVVELASGLQLRFGDAERAGAKWVAAAAVLGDPNLGEPGYIDVSVPERPVAGTL